MRCEDVQHLLEPFAAGDLPAADRQPVEAHLAACAGCRAKLAEIDLLTAALSGTQAPPVPSGFAARVMAAARQPQEAEFIQGWNLLRWWRVTSTPMHAATAAVLVLGLAIGIALGWTAAPMRSPFSAETQADPLAVYQLDYLGEAPSGSLAESYLALVMVTNEGRR